MSPVTIRPLRSEEIQATASFPPPDWVFDAPAFFGLHFGRPYFYPIVAEAEGALAGIACALVFGASAWLGNIIVAPAYRRQGIGSSLTEHLMGHCRRAGCRHQILVATDMGRPVYQKLGFVVTGEYVFLKPSQPVEPPDMSHIRPSRPSDAGAIAALDLQATAEDRRPMLELFIDGGFAHWDGSPGHIDGFYLPGFGRGLVVADNDDAGFALLQLKHSQNESSAILPAGNLSGMKYLNGLGFAEDRRAPRMALGRDVPWRQEMIYARGAGYCG